MQWTIGKKLYSNVAALGLVIVALVGGGSYAAALISGDLDEVVERVTPSLRDILETQVIIARYSAEARLAVVKAAANDARSVEASRKVMEQDMASFPKRAAELEKTASSEQVKGLVRDLATSMKEFEARGAEVAAHAGAFRTREATQALEQATAAGEKANETAEKIQATVTAYATSVDDRANSHQQNANVFFAIMVTAGLLALAVVAYFVRSIVNALGGMVYDLRSGSEQVTSAAGQVATSAQALSQGATEQAASLEETSASMEEMASMTQKNAESSHAAAGLMTEVDARVRESNTSLAEMVGSMQSIQESSQKVGKIIKTIDEIAFQTNILALNAAVEAARAGEAGMGFAVVADEVRNLAQRSAQAAKDTAALIEESIGRAQSGGHKVEQVTGAISGITESVSKVKALVEAVSLASRQQAQGIDQVSQAVAQMEKVTQTTAATAEESAAASEELNAQAETSMQVVRRLESLVGGEAGSRRQKPAAARRAGKEPLPLKLRPHNVVSSGPVRPPATPEEMLPLESTGTFGKF